MDGEAGREVNIMRRRLFKGEEDPKEVLAREHEKALEGDDEEWGYEVEPVSGANKSRASSVKATKKRHKKRRR